MTNPHNPYPPSHNYRVPSGYFPGPPNPYPPSPDPYQAPPGGGTPPGAKSSINKNWPWIVGALLALLVVVTLLEDAVAPSKPSRSAGPVETTAPTTLTTLGSPETTAKPDLPAVPVGQPQTIQGETKGYGNYNATVTITNVRRSSGGDVHLTANFRAVKGTLPLRGAWSLVTTSGQQERVSDYTSTNELEGDITGDIEVTVSGSLYTDNLRLRYVRLQPQWTRYIEGTNQAAVWSIQNVPVPPTTTQTTPPTTAPDEGGSGSYHNYNAPDADMPHFHRPRFRRHRFRRHW